MSSVDIESGLTLKINNSTSSFDSFYQMSVPFQVTYEFCSGTGQTDYINTLILSPAEYSYTSYSMAQYLPYSRSRTLHRHDFYEFMFVIKGSMIQRIEEKEYAYSAGSCCLINRNVKHAEKFTDPACVLFIGVSDLLCRKLLQSAKSSEFPEEKQIYDSSLYKFLKTNLDTSIQKEYLDFFPSFQIQEDSPLYSLADELMHALLFPQFGSSYILKGHLCSFIKYLSDDNYYHTTYVRLNSRADYLLFSRTRSLLEDTSGRITRHELEERLHYSGDYINRIIKKYTGMCLYDYGISICIKRAARLLEETDKSVSEVMKELNFNNPTHFYSLFKRTYGCTPRAYRKKSSKDSI